jgi:hypothetical protein
MKLSQGGFVSKRHGRQNAMAVYVEDPKPTANKTPGLRNVGKHADAVGAAPVRDWFSQHAILGHKVGNLSLTHCQTKVPAYPMAHFPHSLAEPRFALAMAQPAD